MTEYTKYTGLIIDETLTWGYQVNEIHYKLLNGSFFYASVNKFEERQFRVYLLLLVYLGPCVGRLYNTNDLLLLVISLVYFVRFVVCLSSIG